MKERGEYMKRNILLSVTLYISENLGTEKLSNSSEVSQLNIWFKSGYIECYGQELPTIVFSLLSSRGELTSQITFPIEETMLLPVHTSQLGSHVS